MATATKPGTKILIDDFGKVKFFLDKSSLDVFVDVWGDQEKIENTTLNKVRARLEKSKKMGLSLSKLATDPRPRQTGDRIFLYGPTGTGKTHSVLDWIQQESIEHEVVTVSDGFEDIDFLTYIVPNPKGGVIYKKKRVVELLGEAAKWKKVAILIDEVNRGSKSFMNMLLKMIDPVSGFYEINNFVEDDIIKVPHENIIWFCTANLGGWYSGTNALDEALLDRFNVVSFVWYNTEFEMQLFDSFGKFSNKVKELVEYMRQLFTDNAIKRPISSRSLKIRAEEFINTAQKAEDVFNSFEKTVLYRLVSVDNYGFPTQQDVGVLVSKFVDLWLKK